jgi:uroporphyrinogen decarboxylase
MKLSSRQRVLRALRHEEVDRIPIDLIGRVSRLGDGFYQKELWDRFKLDFRRISLRGLEKLPLATPWWGRPRHKDGKFGHPEDYPWPDPYAPGRIEGLRNGLEKLYRDAEYALESYTARWMPLVQREAAQLYHNTDYALVGTAPLSGFLEQGIALWGGCEFMTALLQEKERVHVFLERIYKTAEAFYGMFLNWVGSYLQIIEIGDDIGMNDGLLISPSIYREMIKPYHKRLIAFIKRKTPAKVLFHCCGSIYDIIDDLVEIGVDILSPIQVSSEGMDIQRIKQQYGKVLCLHGGLNERLLYSADAPTLRKHLQGTLNILCREGGYIFAVEHDLQLPLPKANLSLVLDSALNFDPKRINGFQFQRLPY